MRRSFRTVLLAALLTASLAALVAEAACWNRRLYDPYIDRLDELERQLRIAHEEAVEAGRTARGIEDLIKALEERWCAEYPDTCTEGVPHRQGR